MLLWSVGVERRYTSADGYMEIGPAPYSAPYEDDDDLLITVRDTTTEYMFSCYPIS